MKVLSLDLSTTCTGWSTFDYESKELLDYGFIKPKVPKVTKLMYPIRQLMVCRDVTAKIMDLIQTEVPDFIVIEEINRHKNRIAGKTLDILHGILWDRLDELCHKVTYVDSDGKTGWRTVLGLKLTDEDKLHNREAKKLNSKMAKGHKKVPIRNKKHLAARFVNFHYKKDFDVDLNTYDADICDSIGLGHVFINFMCTD
jgi:hypothetical protein